MPSSTEACEICVYWAKDPEVRTGACRRYAPEPGTGKEELAVWPMTLNTDWCGEFRRREYQLKSRG